jgi:phospholipase C
MVEIDRRRLLAGAGSGLIAASSITKAFAIDADVRNGTLMDVDHVVILMQENRGFDHYFGSMAGVRGFGDRFPIPAATGAPGTTVWAQTQDESTRVPFHLDTQERFALMRAQGTPHTWPDTQAAWDEGRMSHWPEAKTVRAMGHYRAGDLPFQFALAEAFTVCDAYHCSIQTGTNSNRLFLWSGTNDPAGTHGGPSIGNSHDSLVKDGGHPDGYRWTTYVERLQAAGVDWRIYQDMKDNFSDNPLAGFQRFRDALAAGASGPDHDLIARGMTTHALDALHADVLADRLPQVSWIVSDAASSEHPAASSPAQGADYTARVISALTANPKVWARTALLVMFDENDGFFDHVPPPAPPSRDAGGLAGASSVPTTGEYHLVPSVGDVKDERPELIGRPYGLGPRVPMYVVSPWSRGGWVNSEVFDHTSVIRFLEKRFGVVEPNISPWRRAVSGDLTSAFDFRNPNAACSWAPLPATADTAARAKALGKQTPATPPSDPSLPLQSHGVRRSRPLPYALDVAAAPSDGTMMLTMVNTGIAGAVLHVYDRLNRNRVPRRYTLGAGTTLVGHWHMRVGEPYDLWLIGPNGFHRHVTGTVQADELVATSVLSPASERIRLIVRNPSAVSRRIEIAPMAYGDALASRQLTVEAGKSATAEWTLGSTSGWYDLALRDPAEPGFLRRFAGRVETGRPTLSDPAMGGAALVRHVV